ncbi:MAG: flagellar export protein FliJ [Bdellovibrionota bacterium]
MAKKFKFGLEALKKYRDQRLLLAKRDLAQVNARHNEIISKIESCDHEARESLGEALNITKNAANFLMGASLVESALQMKKSLTGELATVAKELERHREWVTHLSRELKAVEKLEQRQRERHDKEILTKEKQAMDSWVAERWGRSPLARSHE